MNMPSPGTAKLNTQAAATAARERGGGGNTWAGAQASSSSSIAANSSSPPSCRPRPAAAGRQEHRHARTDFVVPFAIAIKAVFGCLGIGILAASELRFAAAVIAEC